MNVCASRTIFAVVALLGAGAANADTITAWNFDNLPVAINNAPGTSTGVGTAISLGMTNGYTYTTSPVTIGSVTTDDIYADSTIANDTTNAWRIRSVSTNNGPGTGMAGISLPHNTRRAPSSLLARI